MAMKHESEEKRPAKDAGVESREWPARAADLQQEPAIPDDVIFPPDAEKPDKAIPKKSADQETVPANDDVTTTKAEAKEAAPTVVAIAPEDALPVEAPVEDAPAKKAAPKKASAKKA